MDQVLIVKNSAEKGLIEFLKFLLEKDRVSGVFTLIKTKKQDDYDYALITEPELLKDAFPLHPFLPVNAGKILSNFTDLKKPVVAVIKPCELRSFIELVKRTQGNLENFLLISFTCGGAFTFSDTVENKTDTLLSDYWTAVSNANDFKNIRSTCKACDNFIPMNADITVSLFGNKNIDSSCKMFLNSEKAKTMVKGFDTEILEDQLDKTQIEKISKRRTEYKEKLFNEIKIQDTGLDGLIDEFGKCIGCHACSRVCPICYCVLCDFESSTYDDSSSMLESELNRKGGVRLPTDTVLYQIGRLSHMSFSCIGCGQCTEVCPVNIPVSVIFRKIGEKVAKIFDYIPGKDVAEQIPVTIFKEEEFTTLGED